MSYERIYNDDKYRESIIKPINKYAESLYPKPTLVSIDNDKIVLRQHTHAEIFILVQSDFKKFLDRPWIRQFYKTAYQAEADKDCFDDVFVAYTPWIIDHNIDAVFIKSSADTPIKAFETSVSFSSIDPHTMFVNPKMIPFRFMKIGSHMIDSEFGKVRSNTPIYDIILPYSQTIEQKIRNFYAKD